MTDLIERVARAICEANEAGVGGRRISPDAIINASSVDFIGKPYWMRFSDMARAALAALDAEGYAVVPREPNADMLAAAYALTLWSGIEAGCMSDHYPDPEDAWDAMLAAAPKVTPEKPADAPCSHCGKPADTKVCGVGGCPLGADL